MIEPTFFTTAEFRIPSGLHNNEANTEMETQSVAAEIDEAVFAASIPVFVAVSIHFLPYLSPHFLANNKNPCPLTNFLYFGSAEYLIFIISSQLLASY